MAKRERHEPSKIKRHILERWNQKGNNPGRDEQLLDFCSGKQNNQQKTEQSKSRKEETSGSSPRHGPFASWASSAAPLADRQRPTHPSCSPPLGSSSLTSASAQAAPSPPPLRTRLRVSDGGLLVLTRLGSLRALDAKPCWVTSTSVACSALPGKRKSVVSDGPTYILSKALTIFTHSSSAGTGMIYG
jgi:hypothetical protein